MLHRRRGVQAAAARGGIRPGAQNAVVVNVLGIDPGLANTGFGVVARRGMRFVALDGGVVETHKSLPLEQRLAVLFAEVDALMERHAPDAVALEDLFFGQNARSAFAVGQARGVVLLAAGRRGIPCASYTPQQVKQAVCGSGRAAKDQVARMVCALLGLPDDPLPDHATDALAVGVCHANHAPLAQAMAVAR
jgi:crossover junction endodeoxyribonuclease RuvC